MIPEFGFVDHYTAEHYAHLISLALYVVVFGFAANTLRDVTKTSSKTLRAIIRSFLILVMSVATTFGGLQIWWVINNGPEMAPDPTAVAWLIFDWANGLAYFAFVGAVRVYLKWHPTYRPCGDAPEGCPRLKEFREQRSVMVEPQHSLLLKETMKKIESVHRELSHIA